MSDPPDHRQLIDETIRQVARLVARLATTGGARVPLAHLCDLLFHHLTSELDELGLSRKVMADMFGLALRSFQYKIKRLEKNAVQRVPTLRETVLDFVAERKKASRTELLSRFGDNDDRILRSVLRDLVDSRALCVTRSGPETTYNLSNGTPPSPDVDVLPTWTGAPSLPSGLAEHIDACAATILRAIDQRTRPSGRSNSVGFDTRTFDIWPGHPCEGRVRELFTDFRLALSCLGLDVQDSGEPRRPPVEDPVRITFYMGQCVHRSTEADREPSINPSPPDDS